MKVVPQIPIKECLHLRCHKLTHNIKSCELFLAWIKINQKQSLQLKYNRMAQLRFALAGQGSKKLWFFISIFFLQIWLEFHYRFGINCVMHQPESCVLEDLAYKGSGPSGFIFLVLSSTAHHVDACWMPIKQFGSICMKRKCLLILLIKVLCSGPGFDTFVWFGLEPSKIKNWQAKT